MALPLLLAGSLAQAAIAPLSLQPTTNPGGSAYNVLFPGYFAIQLGSGDNFGVDADYHGIVGFWDLKNDPTRQYNLAGINVGLMEYQWGLDNSDGSMRVKEYKQGPGTVTVLENNNVRVRFKYSYAARAFGTATFPADPNLTVDEYFVVYRPDKIYQTFKMSNSNADGKSPLTFNDWQFIPKVTWVHVSNESETLNDWQAHQICSTLHVPMTPSPWLYHYQDPVTDYRNKTYILYSPAGSSSYPLASSCGGAPTPGDISVCTNRRCSPAGISSHVTIKSNFLAIIGENSGNYIANPFQYTWGARSRIISQPPALQTGTNVFVRHAAVFGGDNGITTKAIANEYNTEYRTPLAFTMNVGTTQGFDKELGEYQVTASGNVLDLTPTGTIRNPVFNIASWTAAVPGTVIADGVTLVLNTDYVAVVSGGKLLIQLLKTIPPGGRIQIPAPAGSNVPPNAATLTSPANNATFNAPASIVMNATASDSDGTIARVSFYEGTNLLGQDTSAPYSFTWSNVPAGTYSLTMRATDNGGATTGSPAVSVTVQGAGGPVTPPPPPSQPPPPSVPVTSPFNDVKVYPNPWRRDRHNGMPWKIGGLPAGSEVKIYTLSGHLVKRLQSSAGIATWDLTNESGKSVAAGVYLYVATDGHDGRTQGKFAIIH